MNPNERLEQLAQCLIHIIGRAAIPEDRVREVVATRAKQVKAFNLCDGTRSQSEVARKTGVHQANLSRAMSRWIENGVAFWLGEGSEAKLLHIFPISSRGVVPSAGKRRTRQKGKRR